jgi:hypothetical protein
MPVHDYSHDHWAKRFAIVMLAMVSGSCLAFSSLLIANHAALTHDVTTRRQLILPAWQLAYNLLYIIVAVVLCGLVMGCRLYVCKVQRAPMNIAFPDRICFKQA